ncbi:uncharacterized protein LOC112883534 isoform X2 [Panicum hallii]|uniref:uncharacterized protein LOC112883534 isoform X2 n=1 Tax=Panicum hallii TaxID=206008 RepID=UPI000DF4DCD2|nr:uncharacterized protein LOC112883534 isoform X2 [Panicum hallii]
MNTRPVVLVLLLLVLIITSQFEWKQQIGDAADADPAAARRRQQLLAREDAVKEKAYSQCNHRSDDSLHLIHNCSFSLPNKMVLVAHIEQFQIVSWLILFLKSWTNLRGTSWHCK